MTIKEAILKTLEDLNKPLIYMEIFNHIMDKDYYPDFKLKKTPENTVSANLTGFIKNLWTYFAIQE